MTDIKVCNALFYMVLFCFVVSGCSSKPVQIEGARVESNLGIKGAPDWVNKGSNILNGKNGRMFYGVGSATPQGDMALQKAIADDRARAEIARILSSYLEVVSSDYMATVKLADSSVNEEQVSLQIKNTTKVNMAGARIIGSWRDLKSNTVWSIAELDMNNVKNTMAGITDMNADLKRYIESTADNIFDRVSKENK